MANSSISSSQQFSTMFGVNSTDFSTSFILSRKRGLEVNLVPIGGLHDFIDQYHVMFNSVELNVLGTISVSINIQQHKRNIVTQLFKIRPFLKTKNMEMCYRKLI